MNNLRSIVVGIDFTPGSSAALRQALRLHAAAGGKAVVRAVHVINTLVVVDLQHALSPMQKNIQSSLIQEAKRAWETFEPAIPGKNSIPFDVVIGNATSALIDEADASGADVLILGEHRDAESGDGVGTVAAACVRQAKMRVLLARSSQPGAFKRIVVCVDLSTTSLEALKDAAALAKIDNAQLDILYVLQPAWTELRYFTSMPENSPQLQERMRATAMEELKRFCNPLEASLKGVRADYIVTEHRQAGRGIVEHAVRAGADLIVMGTNGRSGIREFILGSTAERVMRDAPCSMLTVRGK